MPFITSPPQKNPQELLYGSKMFRTFAIEESHKKRIKRNDGIKVAVKKYAYAIINCEDEADFCKTVEDIKNINLANTDNKVVEFTFGKIQKLIKHTI